MLLAVALSLVPLMGCTSEFVASVIATGTATEVAAILGTSLETILFNAFGV
jgi:hypothetical protein